MTSRENNWLFPWEEKIEFGLDRIADDMIVTAAEKAIGESTASQLPGRQNGGAADAYRHLLVAAELSRDYGEAAAFNLLLEHEREPEGGADNGLDMWNNEIGIEIGNYVREQNGTWEDVVKLARSTIAGSFSSGRFDEVKNWKIRSADDGIRFAYYRNAKLSGDGGLAFEKFANDFDRKQRFRAKTGMISLEDGRLKVKPAAMTSPQFWAKHPKVIVKGKQTELSVKSSQFPSREWASGTGFVYEKGNLAPPLLFSENQLGKWSLTEGRDRDFSSDGADQLLKFDTSEGKIPRPAPKPDRSGLPNGMITREEMSVPLVAPDFSDSERMLDPRRFDASEVPVPPVKPRQARQPIRGEAGDSLRNVPVPSPKPQRDRAMKGANPFDLEASDLKQQARLIEENPVLAKRMIRAAGRDPELFGFA